MRDRGGGSLFYELSYIYTARREENGFSVLYPQASSTDPPPPIRRVARRRRYLFFLIAVAGGCCHYFRIDNTGDISSSSPLSQLIRPRRGRRQKRFCNIRLVRNAYTYKNDRGLKKFLHEMSFAETQTGSGFQWVFSSQGFLNL